MKYIISDLKGRKLGIIETDTHRNRSNAQKIGKDIVILYMCNQNPRRKRKFIGQINSS